MLSSPQVTFYSPSSQFSLPVFNIAINRIVQDTVFGIWLLSLHNTFEVHPRSSLCRVHSFSLLSYSSVWLGRSLFICKLTGTGVLSCVWQFQIKLL